MIRLWRRYRKHVELTFSCTRRFDKFDLAYWRAKLFMYIMLYFAPISILAYIPGFLSALDSHLYYVAVSDTLAMIILYILLLNRKITIHAKKILLIISLYCLGVILLAALGSRGPGMIYLIGVSVFATLIFSSRAGYISVGINILIYLAMGAGIISGWFDTGFFSQYSLSSWLTIGANLIMINTVIVISVTTLLQWLNNVIIREKKLRLKLKDDYLQLKKAKLKAEESDRLKSAFLENLSHEIRTPMNAIIGFSELLNENNDRQKQKKYTGIIMRSGERLLSLIEELIDLSKIEAGAMEIKMQETDLCGLLDKVADEMSVICPKNLEFRKNININPGSLKCMTDPEKLSRVIINLLTNAFKYTKEGFVELGLGMTTGNESAYFYVKDTGIGIPAEKQDAVFDRFFQVETRPEGVGLGLAICKSLVTMLGGRIWLESNEGEGTTFHVTIPFARPGGMADAMIS